MNRDEIKTILPHRDSMLLLDQLDREGEIAHGQYRVKGDEWFLQGHFPDAPVVPGVILCEILAQSAGILMQDSLTEDTIPMYTSMKNVRFRAPVLPGAMFLLAYTADGRPIAGLPGCVMYAKRTIFDLALPWLMAGREITPQWLAGLGEGGLCLGCNPCTYPNCGFGK